MKGRNIINIFLALTFLTLSGCSNKQEEPKEKLPETTISQGDTNNSNSKDSSNNATSDKKDSSQNINESSKKDKNTFYGKWKVNKLLAYGKVSVNSEEDINKQIGKVIDMSESEVTYDGKVYSNPKYVERNLSSDEFEQEYKMSLSKLNISGDNIKEVTIDNVDNSGVCITFIIKDENNLILEFNGDYLELIKEK